MTKAPFLALATTVLLLMTACGNDTSSNDREARTVNVDMVDIGFEPDTIDVAAGETVRFVFRNTGAITHDAFIGDKSAQADHATEMRDGDAHGAGHGDGHGGADAVTVAPGDTGELTYTFYKAGTTEIGCHQPGHYAAGMRITVKVS